jgi:alpha-amylase/alpha-mannosidase (GH57 family)
MPRQIHHALILNLHQPAQNLEHLLDHEPWEAKQILWAIDRIPRSLWGWEDVGRVHLSLSGTLLETLSHPDFQARVYGDVDAGAMLWHLQNERIIRVLGTGYYHPVLPLLPAADREEHLGRWLALGRHVFWRERFPGFWPPEMGFCMELIPLLSRLGYRYVVVDSEHVEPMGSMSWQELRYRPHRVRYEGAQIIAVVRDRDLSAAQESGMECGWFWREVADRTRLCDFEPLVVTATDGDNGGWFRNTTRGANFWSAFYTELMGRSRQDGLLRPTFIEDYLERFPPTDEIRVRTGTWNTGWHHGRDFTQWTGSQAQKDSLAEVGQVSAELHRVRAEAAKAGRRDVWNAVDEATWRLLRAETSCNFYWGEEWVGRCQRDLREARHWIAQARIRLGV